MDYDRKGPTGYQYNLLDALRHNPTTIMAGDDICAEAAAEITRLRAERDAVQDKLDFAEETIYLLEYDAKNIEMEEEKRYKRLWVTLDALDAVTAERDAAWAAVSFVRNVAQSAMTAEHDQDECEFLLDLDTLRFQRDCDISAARHISAMIEQVLQVPEAPTGQEDKT